MVSFPGLSDPLRDLRKRYAGAEALLDKACPRPEDGRLDRSVLSDALSAGEAGEDFTWRHHTSDFEATAGADRSALCAHEETVTAEYTDLKHLQDRDAALLDESLPSEMLEDVEGHKLPWTGWDVAQAVFYFGSMFALVAVGLRSMSIVLGESAIEAFEEPMNRLLYSLVLAALATGLKSLWAHADSRSAKRAVFWIVALTGIVFATAWAWLFADTFGRELSAGVPTFEMTGEEFDSSSDAGHGSPWLVFFGIIAEACLAAVFWIRGSIIVEKHQPRTLAVARRMNERQAALSYLADLLARLRSRIEAITKACRVFADHAVAKLRIAKRRGQGLFREAERLEKDDDPPPDDDETPGDLDPERAEDRDMDEQRDKRRGTDQHPADTSAADDEDPENEEETEQ